MIQQPRALVVDDDRAVRTALQVNLTKAGLQVGLARHPEEALEALREQAWDIVISDVRMPGGTGLELLREVREHWPETAFVLMTGYGSVADAVEAMKLGASDYIIKPIAKDELLIIVDRALENRALRAEVQSLRRQVDDRYGFDNLIGATPAMVAVYDEIAAVADTNATVLLQGPTGTGKELLSNAIHQRSSRVNGPFIRVNCAAIPDTLIESELFGHERGAFTGAIRRHKGKFEQADGGTILLDEIGEIDLYMQVKLLRVLESGEFQRVGGTDTVNVNVRVIAATNRELADEVREGRFREDLFYRLNVVAVDVPPLAARRDDIPLLVQHFVSVYAERNNRPIPTLSPQALKQLINYHWPGNVRQLEHVIERAVILCRTGDIQEVKLPADATVSRPPMGTSLLPPEGTTLQTALQEHERRILIAALKASGGVQARAARRLGLSRSNLNYRIHRLGIQLAELEYE